jgi:hypothetical protein
MKKLTVDLSLFPTGLPIRPDITAAWGIVHDLAEQSADMILEARRAINNGKVQQGEKHLKRAELMISAEQAIITLLRNLETTEPAFHNLTEIIRAKDLIINHMSEEINDLSNQVTI